MKEKHSCSLQLLNSPHSPIFILFVALCQRIGWASHTFDMQMRHLGVKWNYLRSCTDCLSGMLPFFRLYSSNFFSPGKQDLLRLVKCDDVLIRLLVASQLDTRWKLEALVPLRFRFRFRWLDRIRCAWRLV